MTEQNTIAEDIKNTSNEKPMTVEEKKEMRQLVNFFILAIFLVMSMFFVLNSK